WKSSEIITTNIAFTSHSMAVLRENDLANRRRPMLCLPTTLGGTIVAVCSRCQSRRNLRIRHGQARPAKFAFPAAGDTMLQRSIFAPGSS
ncbi:MAG: hypothetical protein ACXW3M_13590, partial [Rhodoplanes sp.]